MPERVFAEDSFWYRRLPDGTPTDPDSDRIVAALVRQAERHFGRPGSPNVTINTMTYAPPIYVAQRSDPLVTFGWENCQDKEHGDDGLIRDHLTDVRLPADAVPAEGSDAEMVVYDPAADVLIETWKTKHHPDGSWTACWGGRIDEAGSDDGAFDPPFGVAASGLSLLGGTIRAAELQSGRIDHVVGIALPYTAAKPTRSVPAPRTDGVNPEGWPVPAQGQMLRLPAGLDLDSMPLSPTARAIAEAAQNYGLIVWDTAGAVSFRAENPLGMTDNPYPEIFRERYPYAELAGDRSRGEVAFPLERLEVLPMDYTAPAPTPAPSSTGTTTPPAPVDDDNDAVTGAIVAGVAGLLGGAVALAVLLRRRAARRDRAGGSAAG